MILFEEHSPLQHLNTFGVQVNARYLVQIQSEQTLTELLDHKIFLENPRLILGGGSNILFTKDYDGLIMKAAIVGREILEENEDSVLLKVGSGENWHETVLYCLSHQWGGIENLSLIPGTVGAAPIQNIGAYGAEIKTVINEVHGVDLSTATHRSFRNVECRFGYRESVFKLDLHEKIFISSVTLRLTKKNHHIDTQYGAIQDILNRHNILQPTIKNVSDAVVAIRKSKLPDPSVIGNAGSFFKNPILDKARAEQIRKEYPSMPMYPSDNQKVKIPAGWLIEHCGWKGKRIGNVGVHDQQALVLVNFGGGKGEEIYELAMQIQDSVRRKFDLTLATEVNII